MIRVTGVMKFERYKYFSSKHGRAYLRAGR